MEHVLDTENGEVLMQGRFDDLEAKKERVTSRLGGGGAVMHGRIEGRECKADAEEHA
jgi:hypothetical protein